MNAHLAGLRRACDRRLEHGFVPGRDAFRLVDGPGDDLPGLVVDLYGRWARVERLDDQHNGPAVADALLALLPKLRGAAIWSRPGGAKRARVEHVVGPVSSAIVVEEEGLRYLVRLTDPDAVGSGLFFDMRAGRRAVRAHAAGGPGLNLFAHAGGFGVAMARGGASRVDHVDAARKCAGWAATNLALNGVSPRRHRFLVEDVFKVLRRAARRGPSYQTVVCDPPTQAVRPGGRRFVARDELDQLAAECLRALLPGGLLLLSCNDRRLQPADFEAAVVEAASATDTRLHSVEALSLPPDFTATGPGQRSTQGVVVISRADSGGLAARSPVR